MAVRTTVDIAQLDEMLEAAVLLRAGESGYARDYRSGTAFGADQDGLRLDAFTLGMLDALAQSLDMHPSVLPLLVYLKTLLDHGPGEKTRGASLQMLGLDRASELRAYVAGGRRLILRMLTGKPVRHGLFARLLEQELQNPDR